MGRHDTILRNLMQMSGTRSQRKAMSGWDVIKKVDLEGADEPATCGLCGTRFWSGATVMRRVPGVRKPVVTTIGGTCLNTLLAGQFPDPRAIARAKKATAERVSELYAGLVDTGTWINWIANIEPDVEPQGNLGLVELVEAHARIGRVDLKVERRRFDGFLLVAGQTGEAVSEGIGDAEFRSTHSTSFSKVKKSSFSLSFSLLNLKSHRCSINFKSLIPLALIWSGPQDSSRETSISECDPS